MEANGPKRLRCDKEMRQERKCKLRDQILNAISNLIDGPAGKAPPKRIDVSIRFDDGGLSGANIDVVADRIKI
jgi:hypothetical protein